MLSREERRKARGQRRAEREEMFAKEREATRQRNAAELARIAYEKRPEVAEQLIREGISNRKRERISRVGYTAQENYGITLNDDGTVTVGDPELGGEARGPLAGARATLERPADARDRVTAARVAALGVFALAVPKRDKRLFLVIAGTGFEGVTVVDGSDAEHLRKWVAWFNTRAAAAGSQP
jgi:hypothetical protein